MREAILSLALGAFLGACSDLSGHVPASTEAKGTGVLRVGAAVADLTPPPGYPMAGFSMIGTVARGFWTRLRARAVYLEDSDGNGVVFASLALSAVDEGLVDRVAELLGKKPLTSHLGRDGLVLAATHTHHGPAAFYTTPAYTEHIGRYPGFDARLFEFLAHRIAEAIEASVAGATPATLSYETARVGEVARNRSMPPFRLNPEANALIAANGDLDGPRVRGYDEACYKAVDPVLRVLRAVDSDGQIIALMSFFAAHATTMNSNTEVYNGDFFEVASLEAEAALGGEAVVALFNGPEGDVSPAWIYQDRRDAMRLGKKLGAEIVALDRPGLPIEGALERRRSTFSLADACFRDGDRVRCTAEKGMTGVATLGGAEDGRTQFYDLGWREGVTGERFGRQGSKHKPLDVFTPGFALSPTDLFFPHDSLPKTVTVTLYDLGPLSFATVPGEMTTTMGERVRTAIRQSRASRPLDVVIVGLAGGFIQYITTPEEYEAQHYEGASVLFGPAEGPLIAHRFAELAATEAQTKSAGYSFDYDISRSKEFHVEDIGPAPYRVDGGLAGLLLDLKSGAPIRDAPRLCWSEKTKELELPYTPTRNVVPTGWVRRLSSVDEEGVTRSVVASNEGTQLLTVAYEADETSTSWCVHWLDVPADGKRYELCSRGTDGVERCGDIYQARPTVRFAPDTLPSEDASESSIPEADDR